MTRRTEFQFHIVLAIPALILGFALTGSVFAQEPSVRVVSYSAALQKPNSEYQEAYAKGVQSGTQVSFLVELKNQHITEIVAEDNAFSMTDSKGKKMKMRNMSIAFMSDISDDAASVVFPVASEDTPSSGSNSVTVKGKVTCIVGTDPKEDEMDVNLAKGKKMKLGGIDVSVKEVRAYYEDGKDVMMIETNQSMSGIKSIEVVGEGGKTTELKSVSNSSWGFGDKKTYQKELVIHGKAADVKKLKVTYFQDLKKVAIPLDMKVGFSFDK